MGILSKHEYLRNIFEMFSQNKYLFKTHWKHFNFVCLSCVINIGKLSGYGNILASDAQVLSINLQFQVLSINLQLQVLSINL